MSYVHINPDAKPSKEAFYFTAVVAFIISGFEYNDPDCNPDVALGILVSSVLYTLMGIFIIHSTNYRDRIFGLTNCPSCNRRAITIKDKLKAKLFGKPYSKCSNCGQHLALPWLFVVHFPLVVISPFFAYSFTESATITFIMSWFFTLIYLFYFGRFLNVAKYRT